jgi:hypothetical protein
MSNDDSKYPNGSEYLWELTLFLMTESVLLRSFLEYLRSSPAADEEKMERLINWEKYVGFQFGNPEIDADSRSMLQTILDAPVEVRKAALDRVLAQVRSKYFGKV